MPTAFTVIGKYQVVDRLGEGGMGTLYLARDPTLDRLVAIKVLRGDFDDEEMRERFSREARAVSRLRHPNIVTIFEYGEFKGQPFIAMEYIAGESLAEIVARRAVLPLIRKLRMLDELCAGMAYAHRARIVHRDLKPANIMVDGDGGLIKILDFGIARNLEASVTRFTQVVGTPRYMSPEQAAGARVDHRSDIFAIGTVFYELLSYRQAFDGDNQLNILDKILREEPAPLAQLCPGLDISIGKIVSKALEKDPTRRYQDLEAMRADVQRAIDRVIDSQSEATLASPGPVGPGTPATPRPTDQLEKRRASQIQFHLDAAAQAVQKGDYEGALEACDEVLLLDATNARAVALIEKARAAVEQRALDACLQRVREHLGQRALTQAENALAEALKLRSSDPATLALQRELLQARREEERARERAAAAGQAIARAQACLAEGAFESAVRAASEALAHAPDAAEPRALKERALAAIEQRAREAKARRRAAEAVQAARRQFEAGHHTAAIEGLQRFDSPHPDVDAALAELRTEHDAVVQRRIAEEEKRRRQEEERQRLLELERQRRARQVEALLTEARQRIDSAELDAALRSLSEAEALDPHAADVPALRKQVIASRAAAEAAALRRGQVTARLAKAARLLDAQHLDEALTEAHAALALDADDAEARQLETRIQSALEQRRRLEDLEQRARADAAARARAEEERHEAEEAARRAEEAARLAEAARRARLEEERRQAEAAARARADEADRRRREIERRLAGARDRIADRAWTDALREIDGALEIEGDLKAALDLRATVSRALEDQKRSEEEANRERERRAAEKRRLDLIAAAGESVAAHLAQGEIELAERELAAAEDNLHAETELRQLRARLEARRNQRLQAATVAELAPTVVAMAPTVVEMAPTIVEMAPTEVVSPHPDTLARPARRVARVAIRSRIRAPHVALGAAAAVLLVIAAMVLRSIGRPSPEPKPRPSNLTATALPFKVQRLPNAQAQATIERPAQPIQDTPIPQPRDDTSRQRPDSPVTPQQPPIDTRLGELFEQARGNLAQGRTDEALTTLVTALALKGDDRRFVELLGDMFRQSESGAAAAKMEAERARASELAPGGYGRAEGAMQAARARGATDRTGDAIRNFWRARDLFRDATNEAKRAATPPPRPPGTEPTPPPPPIRSRAEIEAADRQAIDQMLSQYVAAYRDLDPAALARLDQSQSVTQLKELFAQLRSYSVTLVGTRIDLAGDTATVTCVRQIEAVVKRGNQPARDARSTTFKLRRSGSSWVIESVSAK